MAEFDFNLIFTGHCLFAPKKSGIEARVFLPEQGNARERNPNLENHHAALWFPARFLVPPPADPSDEPLGFTVVLLNKRHLKIIPPAGGGNPLSIAGFDKLGTVNEPSLVKKPSEDEGAGVGKFGFWWLAPLERACLGRQLAAGGGVLDEVFLEEELDDDLIPLLAGRVELTRGLLSIFKFLVDPANEQTFVIWRFRSFAGTAENRDHRQILASQVKLEEKIQGDFVTLELRELGDASTKESLKLYPRSGKLPVFLMNEESDQFIRNPRKGEITLGQAHERDRIFESFFDFVKVPPSPNEKLLPVADYRLGVSNVASQPAQSAPPCSPGRLEPYGT